MGKSTSEKIIISVDRFSSVDGSSSNIDQQLTTLEHSPFHANKVQQKSTNDTTNSSHLLFGSNHGWRSRKKISDTYVSAGQSTKTTTTQAKQHTSCDIGIRRKKTFSVASAATKKTGPFPTKIDQISVISYNNIDSKKKEQEQQQQQELSTSTKKFPKKLRKISLQSLLSVTPEKSNSNSNSKNGYKRMLYWTLSLTGVPILVILIALITLSLFVPCIFKRCHQNATGCINHFPFRAECLCNGGHSGNGETYCDECGITYARPNARIVGGKTAHPYSWPSAAMIIASYKTDVWIEKKLVSVEISFMCGGTLINRRTILTAAHCIIKAFDYDYGNSTYEIQVKRNKYYPTEESMYRVFLGLHDRTVLFSENLKPAKSLGINKITVHEEFDEEEVLNDISLLQLEEPVELDRYVQIACLPEAKWDETYPSNKFAWVLGWGTSREGGPTPDSLQNVQVNIYNNSYCDQVLEVNKHYESQICAGDIMGTKDTCQGDSGGSLFVQDYIGARWKYVSAGIVSYGDGCGKKDKPGIYTRTIYYLDWIAQHSSF